MVPSHDTCSTCCGGGGDSWSGKSTKFDFFLFYKMEQTNGHFDRYAVLDKRVN